MNFLESSIIFSLALVTSIAYSRFLFHTVDLLHALHHLVDVLPHDVLDVNQTLVDLAVAIRARSLLIVLLPLDLDLAIYASHALHSQTEASIRVGTRHRCQCRSPTRIHAKSHQPLLLVLILKIGDECVLDVLQEGKDHSLRHVLLRQSQEAHVLINNVTTHITHAKLKYLKHKSPDMSCIWAALLLDRDLRTRFDYP